MAVLPIGFCRGAYEAGVVPFEKSSANAGGRSWTAGFTRKRRGTERRKGHAEFVWPSARRAARAFDFCRPMSELEVALMARHRQPRVGSFGDRI